MGLLDIWSDWKKNNTSYSDGFEDYTETPGSGTLDTAGGIKGNAINATINRKSESPFVKNPPFTMDNLKKVGSNIYNAIPGSDLDKKFAKKEVDKIKQAQVNTTNKTPYPDPITQGATGVKKAEDILQEYKIKTNQPSTNFFLMNFDDIGTSKFENSMLVCLSHQL